MFFELLSVNCFLDLMLTSEEIIYSYYEGVNNGENCYLRRISFSERLGSGFYVLIVRNF